jgi:YD repeat-containing protein
MTSVISGFSTGLLDSSLFLLNRDDRTSEATAGHEEQLYVNIANGDLIVQHRDAYLPSQGEDYYLTRTYNTRGNWSTTTGGWALSTSVSLKNISANALTLVNADSSQFNFVYDLATAKYRSVDGAGAYEEIAYNATIKSYELVRSDQTVLTFDINGTLTQSRDTNGNTITYVYASSKLQSVKDDLGHVITYVYTGADITSIKDETGVVLASYTYANGRLITATDRAGHKTTYGYNTNGTIASVTLPANAGDAVRTLTFRYDPDKTDNTGKTLLLSSMTDAEGNRTDFNYTFFIDNFSKYNGGQTTVLNSLGINRKESNTADNVLWRQTNGYYATWDAVRYTTDVAYKAQADAIAARHTVTYLYDKNGEITKVTDQLGYQTSYQYDLKENLTGIVDANAYAITKSDDAYWRNLRRDYGLVDLAGQGKLVASLTVAEVTALLERYTTHLEYDTRGNLLKRIDNGDNVTTYTYTAFNKLASQTAAMGNALVTSDDLVYQDKRAELGYARTVAGLSAANKTALLTLYTTSYTYDAKQNITEIKTPGGDLIRFTYDAFGNLSKKTVYLDPADLVTVAKQQITQYFYDAYGQNIKTIDAEGFTTLNTFDHFGNLLTFTDARAGVTRYTYDNDNRLLTVTDAEGFVTVNTYDAVGNRTAVKDANGHSMLYVYDRNNMLITSIDPKDGDATGNRTTAYAYDVVGNRTKVTDALGRVSTYEYRQDNRLLQVTTPQVASATGTPTTYTTRYQYDGVGNRIAVTDRNGNLTQYVYNENGLLKQTTDAIGNVNQYRFDANLNQIQIVIGAQLAADKRRVLRFSFDEEDQRIAEYDALNGATRYTRDAVGNIVARGDANGNTTDYSFDRNNRLVKETFAAVIDPATGLSVRHTVLHQFDGNGNQIATTDENGRITRYSFDKDNRLVMLEDANAIKTVFSYDSRHNSTSVMIGVQAHMDTASHVVIDGTTNAQVESYTYNEFNQLTAKTDGLGNALITSDAALYQALRVEMGYAATVAGLTAANKLALLAAYTERYTYDKVGNTVSVTDHLGRITRIDYDALNRAVALTDAQGGITSSRYDGNGNRVSQTDALGRVSGYAYDAVNRLITTTDALGIVTQRQYDNVGNLVNETLAAGTADARSAQYVYDLNNRLTSRTDAQGITQSYEYDAVGNRLKMVDGRGNASRYVYDARYRLLKSIDPLGFETRSEYDGVGNRLTLTDARGGITRLTYDPGNRLLSSTDAEGRITRLEYDVRGNRITQRTAAGTANEEVTQFEYDAENHLRAVIDAAGNRSSSGFDRVYNRTRVTDANGHNTSYTFDALNRVLEMTDAEGGKTSYTYDAVGNTLTRKDALNRLTSYTYDADNRLITETAADNVVTRYGYDKAANRISLTRADGTALAQVTSYVYDKDNRLLSQTDALGHATRYEYDNNNNVTRSIDALNHATTYTYDADNRVTALTDALGNVTQYKYDAVGNRTQVIDARGFITTNYYNKDQELVLSIDNEGYATSFKFDANGNITERTRFAQRVALPADPAVLPTPLTNAADQTVRFGYDKLNRAISQVDAEGYLTRTTYDAVGNRLSTEQFLDIGATRSEINRAYYDNLNRQVASLSAEGYLTEVTYDAVGNRTSQTRYDLRVATPVTGRPVHAATDTGATSRYQYDAVNRLTHSIDALSVDTAFEYDARGNRTAQVRAFGTTDARRTDFRFDLADRLTDEVNANGIITHFNLDADGNILAKLEAFGTADVHTTQYVYDGDHRLVSSTSAIGVVTAFVYDANSNLLSRTLASGTADARTERFEYDRDNRRTAAFDALGGVTRYARDAEGNVTASTDADGNTTDYTFDRNNRLVKETFAAVIDPATGLSVRHTVLHQFDGNGNQIATTDENGRLTRYSFDKDNRLVMLEDANAIKTVYSYDARNNLVSQAVGVTAHVDLAGAIVIDSSANAQYNTYTYDAINRRLSQTDGVGNALISSDAALYQALRLEMGYAALVAGLSAADKQALLAAYTERYTYDKVGNTVSVVDHLGRTTGFAYDKLDRLTGNTDALGKITSYTYDAFNRRVGQTDALGRVSSYAYDAVNRLITTTDALGIVTQRQYDNVGNLVNETLAAGTADARSAQYVYDLNNRLTSRTDAQGITQSYEYDAVGNRLKMVDGRGNASRYVYDARYRLLKSIDPLGFETRSEYDGVGNRLTLTDARGGITRLTYDPGNRLLSSTDAEGRITRLEYDVRGNRITQRTAAGTANEEVTQFEYDAENHLRAVIDAAGNRSSSGFDRVYNRTRVTDANGHNTSYTFDALNRVLEMTDAEGGKTSYTYDAVGNTLTRKDALNRLTSYTYDADNRLITETAADNVVTRYGYDKAANRISLTRADGTALAQVTSYVYDKDNRLLSQTDALGHATRYEYDNNNNVTRSIDALNHATTYTYDADNRVTALTDALGNVTQYKYDAVGNRTQVIDARGFITTNYYNLDREMTLTVDAEGSATAYVYDANGNRLSQTRHATALTAPANPQTAPLLVSNAKDETTRYAYDKLNRQVRVLDAQGYVTDSQYDAAGNLVATRAYATPISFNATTPLSAQTPAANAKDRLTSYSYDKDNRLTRSVDPEGYTTAWTYDLVGNRKSQTVYLDKNDFTTAARQEVTGYTYDSMNRLLSSVSPIGVTTAYTYDAFGNRVSMIEAVGTADIRTTQYHYDAANRLFEEINAEGTVTRLELDAAGQVTREIRAYGLPEARTTINQYDAAGRLIESQHPDGTITRRVYDAVNNLLSRTDAVGTTSERLTTYEYDRDHRLTRQTLAAGTAAALTEHYTYDAFGNRVLQAVGEGTPDARVTQYAYDHNNRLIAQTNGNGIITVHDYDGFGNRVASSVTGTTLSAAGTALTRTDRIAFDYDGRNLIIRQENAAHEIITRDYDGAGNLRFEVNAAGTTDASRSEYRYDLANRRTDKIVDPAGLALVTHYTYDARNNRASETNADGYTSKTTYDSMNRAAAVTDGEGYTVSFGYDRFGNQTAITTGQYLVAVGAAGYDATKATRANPATTRFAYDSMDRMQYQADALGVVTKFSYDARGNRIAKIDAYGQIGAGQVLADAQVVQNAAATQRVNAYRYDQADRLTDEIQPTGVDVHYTYNSVGQVTNKTVDYGTGTAYRNASTRYFYDAGGRLTFEADPINSVTRYQYDDFGNRVRVSKGLALDAGGQPSIATTPDLRVSAFEYDAAHRVTAEVVDPNGLNLRTAYQYDARGNRIALIDANGAKSEIRFDAADRAVWMRDAEGFVISAKYDGRGNRIAETHYAQNGSALAAYAKPVANPADDRTSSFAYDANNRLLQATDARGVVTRLVYDAIGNTLSKTENATPSASTAARTTTYTYNLANLVATQTDASGLVTRFSYDALYNVTQKQAENRWLDTLVLDANGQPTPRVETETTQYRYDLNNRLTDEIVDPAGLNLHTGYRYDSLGDRIATIGANGYALLSSDAAWAQAARRDLGLVDANGLALAAAQLSTAQQQQILNAYSTRTWFDAAGRAVATVDPNGLVKGATYDAVGNLLTTTQYATPLTPAQLAGLSALTAPSVAADAVLDRKVEHVYDKAEREILSRFDLGVETSRAYDAVGNLLREIDGNGYTTYHYYDNNRRMTGGIDAEGYLTVYKLDAFGNKAEERLYLDKSTLTVTQKAALNLHTYVPVGAARLISYTYDAGDHAVRSVHPTADLYQSGTLSNQAIVVEREFDAFGYLTSESIMHAVGETNAPKSYMTYDVAGRLIGKTDARADQLLSSDSAEMIAQRKELGYVNANGQGKSVAELTAADTAAIKAAYRTEFSYDSLNNLREQKDGARVTTYAYDLANRNVRVTYPAAERVDSNAAGVLTHTANYRAVGEITYDAAGNRLTERKITGEITQYRYDRADRQVAALDKGVYVAYGYNFANQETSVHRYFNLATSLDAPPADHVKDQTVLMSYDRLGRVTGEHQLGAVADLSDDRVIRYFYDANGNQVKIIDSRGNTSTMLFDGLNRLVGTINPGGGMVSTGYDAEGNIVSRQTGGFSAPSLVGNRISQDLISDRSILLQWATTYATNGVIKVRRAGSSDAWQVFGSTDQYSTDHAVNVTGLAADTAYEYYFESSDAFGHSLNNLAAPAQFHTSAAIGATAIDNVKLVNGVWQADIHFALPPGATAANVVVGAAGNDPLVLANSASFAPVLQADGSYSATVSFANPDAQFQLQWSDATGRHISLPTAIQQKIDTRSFAGQVSAAPNGAGFDLTVSWNLSDALAANAIASSTDAAGVTRYSVYIGYSLDAVAGQAPNYIEAKLENGVFVAHFNGVKDGARTLALQYAQPDGTLVSAAPLPVTTLVSLNQRYQRIEFSFPDLDTSNTQLVVRTRLAGSSGAWTSVPASAISGLSANLLGLAEGDYEYQADLNRSGQLLRQSGGTLSLREPATVGTLTDTVTPGAVTSTLVDNVLSFPNLLPAAANETATFTFTDAAGAVTNAALTNGTADLTALTPGTYTLHLIKTRSVTTTTTVLDAAGQPVLNADGSPKTTTTTTVTTVADISGSITIGPLTLTNVQARSLSGARSLVALALDAAHSDTLQVTINDQPTPSSDHTWNYYDDNGWKTWSNEPAGVWTRFFYDGNGNVTQEVRFKRRDAAGQFIDAIQDNATKPSLATLQADYAAAMAVTDGSAVRITRREYDAVHNKLSETHHSLAYGDVTDRYAYDRYNNRILMDMTVGITAEENITRTTYDNLNRMIGVSTGPFTYYSETGVATTGNAVDSFTYDARGNKTSHTDVRGNSETFYYDANNRLTSQWDMARNAANANNPAAHSTLKLDYHYDSFGRIDSMTATDLTSSLVSAGVKGSDGSLGKSETTTYEYDNYDQVTKFTDALNHSTTRAYDTGGNMVSETDALGHSDTYAYDAEKRVISRTDKLQNTWRTSYDAYGYKLSETDANGRFTRYTLGAFGQVLATNTGFDATAAAYTVSGPRASSQTTRYDWEGKVADVSDSYGKHMTYSYDDADRQIGIADLALNHAVAYQYDHRGNRIEETLTYNGLVQRHQVNQYNHRGWLTGVIADASFTAGGSATSAGSTLSNKLNVTYHYDQAGNRVQVIDYQADGTTIDSNNLYQYDANNRMTQGVDSKRNATVTSLVYDGFGNRVGQSDTLVATGVASTTSYTYDADNRVVTSNAGEEWRYDALGNTTYVKNRKGEVSTTDYNAASRSTKTVGGGSTTSLTYDRVGNVTQTRVDGDGYGFTEVTQRDMRYLETAKNIVNSWAKGAERLDGATSFTYDVNGNLSMVDRGRKKGANQNSIGVFQYDLEGHIINRADSPTAITSGDVLVGYHTDPNQPNYNGSGDYYGGYTTLASDLAQSLFGYGGVSGTTHLQSYLYADNHSISEASGDQQISLIGLTLQGGLEIAGTAADGSATVVDHKFSLTAGDIVIKADGSIDRAATAGKIAARAYGGAGGYDGLSAAAKQRVIAYIQSQLAAQFPTDAQLVNGAQLSLYGYLQMTDGVYSNLTQRTDYSLRQIGDGLAGGSVMTHTVRAGDTLQSLAQMYFGSPAYWYLIAEANGLQGSEPLAEGRVLQIPNQIANSINNHDTYKVYNESEIIGSTSPEIRTVEKKKKWWQKLVMILIVVIMIVAAVITAGAALALAGPAAAGALASLGALGAIGAGIAGSVALATVGVAAAAVSLTAGIVIAAGIGAVVYAGANILTQGLAIASGLQEEFSWHAVGKSAISGAISGAAGVIGGAYGAGSAADTAKNGINWTNVAIRVGVEAGKQYLQDGKITNGAGLITAAAGSGAFGSTVQGVTQAYSGIANAGLSILEKHIRGKGDNAMDWVNLATSAYGDVMGKDSMAITRDNGSFNWEWAAVTAVGTAIVYDHMGEDAALNHLGSGIGNAIVARNNRNGAIKQEIGKLDGVPLSDDTKRSLAIATLDQDQSEIDRLTQQARTEARQNIAAGGADAIRDNLIRQGVNPNDAQAVANSPEVTDTLRIIKASADAEKQAGIPFEQMTLDQQTKALREGLKDAARPKVTGLFDPPPSPIFDTVPTPADVAPTNDPAIPTVTLETVVVTGKRDSKGGFIATAANVLDSTSAGVNKLVDTVGAGVATATVFGIQLALGGVPKTLISFAADSVLGDAKHNLGAMVGGLIADYAFDVKGEGAAQAEDINKVSNALGGFGVETALGSAGGMILSSRAAGKTMDAVRDKVANSILQPRFVAGFNGRLESAFAKIEKQHIGTGTETNPTTRLFARAFGKETDDAGHAIGKNLGGSGTDISNIIPQAPNINRGAFRDFEKQVAREVEAGNEVFVRVVPKYESANVTRPSEIVYQLRVNGNTITRTFKND